MTISSSTSTSLERFSAFAMAESRTFSTIGAMRLLVWRRMMRASLADRPRMRSTTSRAFCGDVRTYLASALASIEILVLGRLPGLPGATRRRSRGLHRVPPELARGRKFAQFVAYHVFGDVHRDKLL